MLDRSSFSILNSPAYDSLLYAVRYGAGFLTGTAAQSYVTGCCGAAASDPTLDDLLRNMALRAGRWALLAKSWVQGVKAPPGGRCGDCVWGRKRGGVEEHGAVGTACGVGRKQAWRREGAWRCGRADGLCAAGSWVRADVRSGVQGCWVLCVWQALWALLQVRNVVAKSGGLAGAGGVLWWVQP